MPVEADIVRNVLMYFIMPLWLAAGFADWLCHRAAKIETTTGPKESLIHLLMFVEMAVPITAAIALEVNALVLLVMIVFWFAHELTGLWDVTYASSKRSISSIEQYVHTYLGLLPLTSLLLVVVLHWQQFLALLGMGVEVARFTIVQKQPPLPWIYVTAILSAT